MLNNENQDQPTTDASIAQNRLLADGTLLEFLDYNLEKSKNEKGSNPLFMAGWIAALMHVKVNYLQQLNSDSACS